MVKQDLVELRRQQILSAAFKVFAELGYHNAGIADIAREVGTGHGTFYRYFANKRDILDHVLTYAAEKIAAALADQAPTASDTAEEYRAQVERMAAPSSTCSVLTSRSRRSSSCSRCRSTGR